MIKICKNCGMNVSDEMDTCPDCGENLNDQSNVCPECGHYVDINMDECPYCAYPIKEKEYEKKAKKSKLRKYIVTTIIVVLFFAILLSITTDMFMSDDMKALKISVQEVQGRLLAPDSMVVYYCDYVYEKDDDEYYVYMYVGAANRGGGISDDIYMVHIVDGKIESSANSDDAKSEEFILNKAAYRMVWIAVAGKGKDWVTVDTDKVQRFVKK